MPIPSEFRTAFVGGIPFAVADLDEATSWLLRPSTGSRGGVAVRLANAYSVALGNENPEYGRLLVDSGINFADGAPVAQYIRFRSRGIASKGGRVRGPSLFIQALKDGQDLGIRHQFIGTTPDVLSKLRAEVAQRFPRVHVVDSFAPPFGPVDEQLVKEVVTRVEQYNVDIVWIALGTPKQDFAATAIAAASGRVTVAVGAAFDFVAGTVAEAPRWIQRSGFEWAYRLVSEPRRLWRRYLFGNVRFLWSLLRPSPALRRA